jgi:hypothetical protein
VFSRLLIDLINYRLGRNCLMYVDDVCGAGPQAAGEADREIAREAIEEVMGPGSVALPKTEKGRSLVMLGWDLDLDRRFVSLSRKNLCKTLFAFFVVDVDGQITLPVLQALASRASRAALLSPAMKPFTRGLFGCMNFYEGDRGRRRKLSAEAQFEVLMWRAYLVQLMWDPGIFARSLESFRPRPADFRIEYDASLEGFGLQIWRRDTAGSGELVQWIHWGGKHPFGTQEGSGFQNCCEYTAVLAALLILRQRGCREFAVDIVGDNTSSLAWLRKGRASSAIAQRASVGLSLLMARLGAHVHMTEHVAGILNGQMDGLSRGKSSIEVGLDPIQFSPLLKPGSWVWRYLVAARPGVSTEAAIGFVREFLDLLHEPVPSIVPATKQC